jgi:MFS transporter, PHS family, inorganic phosphate transporter
MLATVFYAQPLGQLIALIVSIIVTAAVKGNISGDNSVTNCSDTCLYTLDQTWRWIVGFGAVLPIISVVLRFWIPESPRWLLEVKRDPMGIKAADYTREKFIKDPSEETSTAQQQKQQQQYSDQQNLQANISPNITAVGYPIENFILGDAAIGAESPILLPTQDVGNAEPITIAETARYSRSTIPNSTDEILAMDHPKPITLSELLKTPKQATGDDNEIDPQLVEKQLFESDNINWNENAFASTVPNSNESVQESYGKEEFREFLRGFITYLFGKEPWSKDRLWNIIQFKDTHFFEGSWTDLAGTSFTWFLLDFSFYFLTVNSPTLISKIWDSPGYTVLYRMLMDYSWRAMISTSTGALIGGAIFIAMAKYRWNLQLYGFLILGALFLVVGVCFMKLVGGRYFAAVIVLYTACNLFFDLGPNTSTFIVRLLTLTGF